ncbi:MAG: 5-oxoprolinase subunit PxpB [Ilumatobacteraceae bacterium]
MRVRPYGHEATIIDQLAHGTAASLRDTVLDVCKSAGFRCIDVVPAASSLVVTHEARDGEAIRRALASVTNRGFVVSHPAGSLVEIAVRYDGVDLADVARACSLTVEQVITLHSEAEYEVSFCGFAPGFAYLSGLPRELHLPRRSSPRTRVPAGSVAIAATYSAVYPRESPGGWHLLGTTTANLWDVSRGQPALLQPGIRVRFVRVM